MTRKRIHFVVAAAFLAALSFGAGISRNEDKSIAQSPVSVSFGIRTVAGSGERGGGARPVGEGSIQVQTQDPPGTILYFSDYVEGGGWSVQLVLSNVAAATAEVVVEVYGQDGRSVRDLFDSEPTFEIPALGSRVLRSAGLGTIRRGWIKVRSNLDSVRGLLTYRHDETGIEVGVAPVPLGDRFALFVEESSEIGTGLAIFKPDADPEIELQIHGEEGEDPIGEILRWGNFQQRALTLPEWLEGVDTKFLTDFRGLLFLRVADEFSFAPLGLRFGKRKGSLSAVPVIPIRDSGGAPNPFQLDTSDRPDLLYFPDYVEGGGWSVQLMLSNLDTTRFAAVVVAVYDQQGQRVSKFFDSATDFEIPALGSRVLRSAGTGPIQRGWIKVKADPESIRGLLTYRHVGTGIEVGVQPVPLGGHFALFIEESSEIGTGLAIFNPHASSEIEFQVRNEAGRDPLEGEVLTRGDFRQRAQTLQEWFEGVDQTFLRDFRGLLSLRSTDGSEFAPLGLRFGKQKGSLSAVPVIPLRDRDVGLGKIYWADNGGPIQRANLNGTGVETLISRHVTYDFQAIRSLALDPTAGKMYWTNHRYGEIQRANLDGTGVETLIDARSKIRSKISTHRGGYAYMQRPTWLGLDLPARRMYWIDMDVNVGNPDRQSVLATANLNGGAPRVVTSTNSNIVTMALDLGAGRPGKMYWTEYYLRSKEGSISWGNLNRGGTVPEPLYSGIELLVRGLGHPTALVLDPGGGKMYWTEIQYSGDVDASIKRANLDGTGVETLIGSTATSFGLATARSFSLALDPGGSKMYWTIWELGSKKGFIVRANLDGSGAEILVSGLRRPTALALDPVGN